MSNLITKLKELLKTEKGIKIIVGGVFFAILALIIIVNSTHNNSNTKTIEQKNTSASTTSKFYNPTEKEKDMLKKSYKDFSDNDYSVFYDLEKKYSNMTELEKKNIKSDMDRIKKEKSNYSVEYKKQSEENSKLYADFIKEVSENYKGMKVSSIGGKDKQKTLNIDMLLLDNLDATYRQCTKLTLDKETRMKEIGINDIVIMVNNKSGENQGILSFKLDKGRYEPRINTFK